MARNVSFNICHQHQRQWAKDLNFYAGKIQINLTVSLYLPYNDVHNDKNEALKMQKEILQVLVLEHLII